MNMYVHIDVLINIILCRKQIRTYIIYIQIINISGKGLISFSRKTTIDNFFWLFRYTDIDLRVVYGKR